MRITVYQPQFFPRLHYFNRILDSDLFVVLGSAQYVKSLVHKEGAERKRHKSYQSDTPVKGPQGLQLLTVPISHNGQLPINETQVHYGQEWQSQHLRCIQNYYAKAPETKTHLEEIKDTIETQYDSLAQLNLTTILWAISRLIGAHIPVPELSLEAVNQELAKSDMIRLTKIVDDREIGVERPEGRQQGTAWTIAICQALQGTEYTYGGTAASAYMDMDAYAQAGIKPVKQDWKLQPYPQRFDDRLPFMPNLSIIDLLLNIDRQHSLRLLTTSA